MQIDDFRSTNMGLRGLGYVVIQYEYDPILAFCQLSSDFAPLYTYSHHTGSLYDPPYYNLHHISINQRCCVFLEENIYSSVIFFVRNDQII